MASRDFKLTILVIVLIQLCFLIAYWLNEIFLWSYIPTTVYSEEYSEDAFDSIDIGMSIDEVYRVLGNPRREFAIENITFIIYSDIGKYTSTREKAYHQRWIASDQTNRVIHIFRRTIAAGHNPTRPLTTTIKGPDNINTDIIRDKYKKSAT